SEGNIVAAGIVDGMGKLVLGNKSVTLPAPGAQTMFLAKFTSNGGTSFAEAVGTDGVQPEAVAVDTAGNIVTTGENSSSRFLSGVAGVFVAKFSSGGGFRSGRIIGSIQGMATSIAVNPTNNHPIAAGFDQ